MSSGDRGRSRCNRDPWVEPIKNAVGDDLTLAEPPLPAEGLVISAFSHARLDALQSWLLSHVPIACNRSTADFPLSSPLIEFGEHDESPIG